MKNYELIDNNELENMMLIKIRINQLEEALKKYPEDKFLTDQLKIAQDDLNLLVKMNSQPTYDRRIEIIIKDYSPSELGYVYSLLNKLCKEDNRFTYESFDK